MKIIAAESGPPVGPEFTEVVEGQRIGISVDQGIERMVERMPLAEVNFLAIVMAIQSKTGGNLSPEETAEGALTVLNPEYLNPLLYTTIGNIMLGACGVWMTTGVLVMRKMINFEI